MMSPHGELDQLFADLLDTHKEPLVREQMANAWISAYVWGWINRRASLRKHGRLSQAGSRRLGRCIKVELKDDRRRRAAFAGTSIKGLLVAGEVKEAWRVVQKRYRQAGGNCTTWFFPHPVMPDTGTKGFVQMGRTCWMIRRRRRIWVAIVSLSNGRAGGASHHCAEDIKLWLADTNQEEMQGDNGEEEEPGRPHKGDR